MDLVVAAGHEHPAASKTYSAAMDKGDDFESDGVMATWAVLRAVLMLFVGAFMLYLFLQSDAQTAHLKQAAFLRAEQAAALAHLPLTDAERTFQDLDGPALPLPTKGDVSDQIVAAQTLADAEMSVVGDATTYDVLYVTAAFASFAISASGFYSLSRIGWGELLTKPGRHERKSRQAQRKADRDAKKAAAKIATP